MGGGGDYDVVVVMWVVMVDMYDVVVVMWVVVKVCDMVMM